MLGMLREGRLNGDTEMRCEVRLEIEKSSTEGYEM